MKCTYKNCLYTQKYCTHKKNAQYNWTDCTYFLYAILKPAFQKINYFINADIMLLQSHYIDSHHFETAKHCSVVSCH